MEDKISMVVVMGVTGAGKSHFINKLAGREVTEEGNSLYACTRGCQLIPLKIGGMNVCVIDTPGFDEAQRTDSAILEEIASLLSAQYQLGVELKGIIYIHRITDVRYTGSAIKTFQIFQKICGEKPLKNVLLVTSQWTKEMEEGIGSRREGELRESFWSYMLNKGSKMSRFHGDRDSAIMLISQLLVKDSVVLDLQRELVDERKQLKDTVAGSFIHGWLEGLKTEYKKEVASLEMLKQSHSGEDRAVKRRIQKDVDNGKTRLREIQNQQASLKRNVGDEVGKKIKRKRDALVGLLPALLLVFNILATFVGFPPSTFTADSAWFQE